MRRVMVAWEMFVKVTLSGARVFRICHLNNTRLWFDWSEYHPNINKRLIKKTDEKVDCFSSFMVFLNFLLKLLRFLCFEYIYTHTHIPIRFLINFASSDYLKHSCHNEIHTIIMSLPRLWIYCDSHFSAVYVRSFHSQKFFHVRSFHRQKDNFSFTLFARLARHPAVSDYLGYFTPFKPVTRPSYRSLLRSITLVKSWDTKWEPWVDWE